MATKGGTREGMKIAAQHTRWYRQQFEYFTTVCVLGKRSVVCNAEPCKIQKAKTKMTKNDSSFNEM